MEKLSQVLWRERELLESLSYRLEVEGLLLAAGRGRWLVRATDEVEQLLVILRETEVLRAVVADEAAAAAGLPSSPSLSALAESVDEPWRAILLDHREAFLELTAAIEGLAQGNRELLSQGLRSTRETLLDLEQAAEGYRPDGGALVGAPTPRLIDRSM